MQQPLGRLVRPFARYKDPKGSITTPFYPLKGAF